MMRSQELSVISEIEANEMFGHTNDDSRYMDAIRWKKAAIADGWNATPTYESESIESATKLEKDGFICTILTRTNVGQWKYVVSINIWGPDKLVINPPTEYSWEKIINAISVCSYCYRKDVETQRVGFAGRCCADCIIVQREKIETVGWCN